MKVNVEVCFKLLDTLGKGAQMHRDGDAAAVGVVYCTFLLLYLDSIAEWSQAHAKQPMYKLLV